jgi:hypothetical protein
MEQSANKPSRLRRSQNQIEQLLEEFEKGNLDVAEFCELHAVSRTTFYKWQSRYRRKTKKNSKARGFAKLKIAAPAVNPPGLLFAEVNGIKLYQPVTASYLKELCLL